MSTGRGLFSVILILCCVAASARAQQPSGATGKISGRITVGDKPLAGVSVVLMSTGMPPQRPLAARTETDREGRFRLSGVPAGRFVVTPLAPVFVLPYDNTESSFGTARGKVVVITDGETLDGIDFTLARGGVITGRVTDKDGRPVIGEIVRVRSAGRPYQIPFSASAETDDRGVYRVYGLPENVYTVSVGEDRSRGETASGNGRGFYQRTYHPGVSDEEKARVIEVGEGAEVSDVDIKLNSAPSQTFAATGRIVDAETGEPVRNISLAYGPTLPKMVVPVSIQGMSTVGDDGAFRIQGLTPGHYSIVAPFRQQSELSGDPLDFNVTDADVGGLEVRLQRGASISGVVTVEGVDDPASLTLLAGRKIGVQVQAPGKAKIPGIVQSELAANGGFRLTGLRPGFAQFQVSSLPPGKGFSVLRVEQNGSEQPRGIELAPGQSVTGVRVVVGYAASALRGRVTLEGGALPPGAKLFIAARRLSGDASRTSGFAEADEGGRFVIEGLVAGEYEVTALATFVTAPGVGPPRVKQNISVSPGEATDITLVLVLNVGQKSERPR